MQVVQTASQWMLEWAWPAMAWDAAERTQAWLDSLRGQVGTFRYAPIQRYASSINGATLSLVGYASNTSLRLGSLTPNAATNLTTGRYLQVGDQLLRLITAPVMADGNGQMTITVEPELRLKYAIGTAVNFATPRGLFRLMASEGAAFTLDPDKRPVFGTMQAREAFE